jgi:hypothetical protein
MNLRVRIKIIWTHSTPIIPSCQPTDGQSLLQSSSCLLPQSSLSAQLHVSGETISFRIGLMSAAAFVHAKFIEDKEVLVYGCVLE